MNSESTEHFILANILGSSISQLTEYIERESFRGYDPYDALNSVVLSQLAGVSKWRKIGFTQVLKRISFNLRPLIGIRKGYNPKGMGLFLNSYSNLYKVYRKGHYFGKIRFLTDWLIENSCNGYSGHCWGYNFDWQSRAFFLPKGTPTIVNTCFIANAFLDVYDIHHGQELLDIARSSCEFVQDDLNRTGNGNFVCFSYTPIDQTEVYNASLLGACLLARVYSYTGESQLLDLANRSADFVVAHQNDDGSWHYGNAPFYEWIDGYHTGFVLENLYDYIRFSGRSELTGSLIDGLSFYKENLFTPDIVPKFRNDSLYPIDIHCCAQAIITFAKLRDLQSDNLGIAGEVAKWTVENMQDRNGYFYFQKHRFHTNKIPYMRWGQAWMLRALSQLLFETMCVEERNGLHVREED